MTRYGVSQRFIFIMKYNPAIHHRQSTRLKGYDYTQFGQYFITICVKDKKCSFGYIQHGRLYLNEIGLKAEQNWLAIPQHYSLAVLHAYVIMPNHIHGVIEIQSNAPDNDDTRHGNGDPENCLQNDAGTRHGVSLQVMSSADIDPIRHGLFHQKFGSSRKFAQCIPGSVSTIINQYKSSVKRWCNQNGHETFQWQSRFHDYVIRSDDEYRRISRYIENNIAQWNKNR